MIHLSHNLRLSKLTAWLSTNTTCLLQGSVLSISKVLLKFY